MENLTPRQAYLAMFLFLDEEYKLTKSDELAFMLSPMQIMEDGMPVNSAIWPTWLEAVEKARNDNNWELVKLRLTKE